MLLFGQNLSDLQSIKKAVDFINQQLESLYYAFDKSALPVVCLRVRHESVPISWVVDNRTLYINTEYGSRVGQYDLQSHTIAQLVPLLQADNLEVVYVNQDKSDLSAAILINGSGKQTDTNGDALYAYDSLLWSMVDSYALELMTASLQIQEALKQLYLNTAEDEILDYWGEYFAVPRDLTETDTDYRARIIYEVLRPKSNKYALENAATKIAGAKVEIYEPWVDLFYLSESKLDHHIIYDGQYWSPYIFRPFLRSYHNIDLSKAIAMMEKIRPAGVLMATPEWIPDVRHVDVTWHSVGLGREGLNSMKVTLDDRALYDYYNLDSPIIPNYNINIYDVFVLGVKNPVEDPYTISSYINFVKAQIILSDNVGEEGFGHEDFIFTGSSYVTFGSQILSDFSLSDMDDTRYLYQWEDRDYLVHYSGARGTFSNEQHMFKSALETTYTWDGNTWNGRHWLES